MSKPTITKAMIRRKIREVLAIRPGFGKTERFLLESVNELTGGGVSLQELRDGVEWSVGERLVRSHYDEEAEELLYHITREGLAKENLK